MGDQMNNNRNCLTREAGLALVNTFYSSGMKQKDFCKANNVAYHILQYWKQIQSKVNAKPIAAKFLPIKLAASGSVGVKVVINAGLIIEVNQDSDLDLLKKVIEVCMACG
jgi:hypothetical protein